MGRFDQEGSSDLISTLRPCDTGGVKVKSCSMCQDSRTRHRTAQYKTAPQSAHSSPASQASVSCRTMNEAHLMYTSLLMCRVSNAHAGLHDCSLVTHGRPQHHL